MHRGLDQGELPADRHGQRGQGRRDEQERALRQAVCGCDIVLADGQAVVWASRLLGRPLPERVTGIDLFTELLGQAAARGDRVYFLGARAEVGQAMIAEVRRRHPELVIAGYRDGYFGPEQDGEVADSIKQTSPDLLFIGMSSPRKELFTPELRRTDRCQGRARGRRVIRHPGRAHQPSAGLVAAARAGMAVPHAAGAGQARPPVRLDESGVHDAGRAGGALPARQGEE